MISNINLGYAGKNIRNSQKKERAAVIFQSNNQNNKANNQPEKIYGFGQNYLANIKLVSFGGQQPSKQTGFTNWKIIGDPYESELTIRHKSGMELSAFNYKNFKAKEKIDEMIAQGLVYGGNEENEYLIADLQHDKILANKVDEIRKKINPESNPEEVVDELKTVLKDTFKSGMGEFYSNGAEEELSNLGIKFGDLIGQKIGVCRHIGYLLDLALNKQQIESKKIQEIELKNMRKPESTNNEEIEPENKRELGLENFVETRQFTNGFHTTNILVFYPKDPEKTRLFKFDPIQNDFNEITKEQVTNLVKKELSKPENSKTLGQMVELFNGTSGKKDYENLKLVNLVRYKKASFTLDNLSILFVESPKSLKLNVLPKFTPDKDIKSLSIGDIAKVVGKNSKDLTIDNIIRLTETNFRHLSLEEGTKFDKIDTEKFEAIKQKFDEKKENLSLGEIFGFFNNIEASSDNIRLTLRDTANAFDTDPEAISLNSLNPKEFDLDTILGVNSKGIDKTIKYWAEMFGKTPNDLKLGKLAEITNSKIKLPKLPKLTNNYGSLNINKALNIFGKEIAFI